MKAKILSLTDIQNGIVVYLQVRLKTINLNKFKKLEGRKMYFKINLHSKYDEK